MTRFIAVVAILLVLILGGIYAAGWLTFDSDDNSATIEIKTGEMEQAAQDAGVKARKIVEDAQKTIETPAPTTAP